MMCSIFISRDVFWAKLRAKLWVQFGAKLWAQSRTNSLAGILLTDSILVFMLCFGLVNSGWASDSPLGLKQAIADAIHNDAWLEGSQLKEKALFAEGIAAAELPDPSLSVDLANLAADTFDFDQEPMTQFKVGLAQRFPRGNTRALKRRQKMEEGAAYPQLREDRKAQLARKVSLLWLDGFLAQQSIVLIERNRYLFDQLVDITHANYITTSGATRQQDVIRAELELTQLNDRLISLRQRSDSARQALLEWLSPGLSNKKFPETLPEAVLKTPSLNIAALNKAVLNKASLSKGMPNTVLEHSTGSGTIAHYQENTPQLVAQIIQQHPRLKVIDRKLEVETTRVDLARQQYKPEWGFNAAYSYREDTPFGADRADFISFGITVDLPLFTENRQDQGLAAATHRRAALRTERDLLLRELVAGYQKSRAELQRLDEREQLYQRYLLPQIHDQADATLSAYTSDGGDFSEVMRARIAELNTEIKALELKVERQKMIARINYFIVGAVADGGVGDLEKKEYTL